MIIPNLTRITITLPEQIVRQVDARTQNRSRFILAAVERELRRAEQAELRKSLANPHSESAELAESGLQAWTKALPDEDVTDLVDLGQGQSVRWEPGMGWKQTARPPSKRTPKTR